VPRSACSPRGYDPAISCVTDDSPHQDLGGAVRLGVAERGWRHEPRKSRRHRPRTVGGSRTGTPARDEVLDALEQSAAVQLKAQHSTRKEILHDGAQTCTEGSLAALPAACRNSALDEHRGAPPRSRGRPRAQELTTLLPQRRFCFRDGGLEVVGA